MIALCPLLLALFATGAVQPTQESEPVAETPSPETLRFDRGASLGKARAWLRAQQEADGHWDCSADRVPRTPGSDLRRRDDGWSLDEAVLGDGPRQPEGQSKGQSKGPGGSAARNAKKDDVRHDIGVTGLALLALMPPEVGAEPKPKPEDHMAVARGIQWLISQQDEETGMYGQPISFAFHYDHAIATLAVARWYRISAMGEPHAESMQAAANYIARARNPYGAWRYDNPPTGENDTSVSTWMILAIKECEAAGAKVDREAGEAVLNWIDEVTDPKTGRVGYTEAGSPSSRVPGVNDQFRADLHETLTAAGMLCRVTLGQSPRRHPVIVDHLKLMISGAGAAREAGFPDALGAYFGTRAIAGLGGRVRETWEEAVLRTAMGTQETKPALAGSWGPNGPWGYSLGRTGETALFAAALAVSLSVPMESVKATGR